MLKRVFSSLVAVVLVGFSPAVADLEAPVRS